MNDVFDFRRFGKLANLYYKEKKKPYLVNISLAFTIVFLYLAFSSKLYNPAYVHIQASDLAYELQDYNNKQYLIFSFVWVFLSMWMTDLQCRDYTRNKEMVRTCLLPVSMTERFVFAFFNVTVVNLLVFLFVFYLAGGICVMFSGGFVTGDSTLVDGQVFHSLQDAFAGVKNPVYHRYEITNIFDSSQHSTGILGGYWILLFLWITFAQAAIQNARLSNSLFLILCLMGLSFWSAITVIFDNTSVVNVSFQQFQLPVAGQGICLGIAIICYYRAVFLGLKEIQMR